MAKQALYRSGSRSAATARRLIAATSIAPHVIQATIYDERFDGKAVAFCKANERIQAGNIVVEAGQHFYIVASKFVGRFYIVNRKGQSSSKELETKHLQLVKQYIAERIAAKAEKAAMHKLANHKIGDAYDDMAAEKVQSIERVKVTMSGYTRDGWVSESKGWQTA